LRVAASIFSVIMMIRKNNGLTSKTNRYPGK
jgi:hypothetical protein